MPKTPAPTRIEDQELAQLLDLQKTVERTAAKLVDTHAAHKAAKAAHDEAQERLGQFLYSLHHGLPLFDGEAEGEE